MRSSPFFRSMSGALSVSVWLSLSACVAVTSNEGTSEGPGQHAEDGGETLLPDGGPVEPPGAGPYGYDTRPANPTCVAPARPKQASGVALERAFPNLQFNQPLHLLQAPGEAGRVFVVERPGTIVVFPNVDSAQDSDVTTFLDISTRVDTSGEGGLLGMAFHPDWPTRREVFVSYTETGSGSPLRSVISRFKSTDNGVSLDLASEERLLTLDQPWDNHNGGHVAFGPDGYLYMGFGDGGSGGDPLGSGQQSKTLLGKFVRIDVNVPFSQRYAIPASNPYAQSGQPCNRTSSAWAPNVSGPCAEIFALGFRNPWRWSFDVATGELWAGDVGQNAWEEVDRVVLGGNYGWSVREGAHCYNAQTCATAGLIDPVVEYSHAQGLSITGGYVYRGSALPQLLGKFIYGDYSSGRIWAVGSDPSTGKPVAEPLLETSLALASFGQLHDGEVFALDIATGGLHRLVRQGNLPANTFPQKLSETGCFLASDPRQAVSGLIPYDLNAALWSDGADKQRFLALPDGTTLTVGADGDWTFPVGTVTAKTFFLDGKRVETRLLMRHPDGTWAGYSYEWKDDESDALLLPSSKQKQVGSRSWYFPSRAQCLGCHTAAAGRTLGLETAQLNRSFLYPSGRTRNQLTTLEGLGFFSAPLGGSAAALPRLEPPHGTGPLADRARAYLHANCAGCHRQGAGQGPQDFRYTLKLSAMNACDVAPQNGSLGVVNARILAPGAPARSLLSVRMHALNAYRMPPLGSAVEDVQGTQLVDAWIASLSGCTP